MRYKKKVRQYARCMRKNPVPAERILIQELKANSIQFWFQVPVFKGKHGYIVDFLFKREGKPLLVVELDGKSHESKIEYDIRRTADLADKGFEVLRFENTEVYEDPKRIVSVLLEADVLIVAPKERGGCYGRQKQRRRIKVETKKELVSLYKKLSPRDKLLLQKELDYKRKRGISVANPSGR